jgi:hypothetical protein
MYKEVLVKMRKIYFEDVVENKKQAATISKNE